jgi:glycolate oxidase
MSSIVDLDVDDMSAVVESGVITGDLQRAVEEHGLFYPPDPASLDHCTIGGNVATNAGGPRAFRYGVTRDFVMGLDVALMGGETIAVGRNTIKSVSGFDLLGPFVGSEGCLGIATRARLKLIPKPEVGNTVLAFFSSVESAVGTVSTLLRNGFYPSAMELLDRRSLAVVSEQLGGGSHGAALLIELEGDEDTVQSQCIRLGQACEERGAVDVRVATSATERRRMWNARRSVSRALKARWPAKVSEDIAIPRKALVTAFAGIDALSAEMDIPMAAYGHVGDGNLHVNFLVEVHQKKLDTAVERLFRMAIDLGGTLSGEHGIGASKRSFMNLEHSPAKLAWYGRLKALFDPDNLLNPGKVLP